MEQFIKNMTPTQACFVLMYARYAYHNAVSHVAKVIAERYNIDRQTDYSYNVFKENVELIEQARKIYYNDKRAKLKRDAITFLAFGIDNHVMVAKAGHSSLVRPTIPFLLAKGFHFNKRDTVYRLWIDNEIGLEIDTNQKGTALEMTWNLIGVDEGDYQFCQMLPSNKLTVDNINQLLNIVQYNGET